MQLTTSRILPLVSLLTLSSYGYANQAYAIPDGLQSAPQRNIAVAARPPEYNKLDDLRAQYFESFMSGYFLSRGIDVIQNTIDASLNARLSAAEQELASGIELKIGNQVFRVSVDLTNAKRLEIGVDGVYMKDLGINGVDEYGRLGLKFSRKTDTVQQRRLPIDSTSAQRALDELQLASLKVLAQYFCESNAEPSLNQVIDAKRNLDIITRVGT